MKILDLGCGNNKNPGSIGADISKDSKADVVCDLNRYPLPFKSDSFDQVISKQVFEHLEDVEKLMSEIYRITKNKARISVYVPHFSHPDAFRDPTHIHFFSYFSFGYFTGDPLYPKYTDARYKIVKKEFRATSGLNRFLSSRINPHLYEERYARIFPSYGLYIELKVVK